MAKTKAPRPNKNSDGMPKQPSYTHTIHIDPAKPEPPQAPTPPPGAPAPGTTNPMTHPAHPSMQSSLGAAAQQGPKISGTLPEQGNANPTGNPLGNLTPTPTQDQRQVREQIQFKDMSPPEQAQTSEQQGLDPYAPLKMVQQGAIGALQAGPSTGPLPNMLAGPYVPPGIEAFPDDFAHLSTLMKQGYAPGSSPQEHEFAQNAHAMVRAKIDNAFSQSQNGVGQEQAQPYAPSPTPGAPSGEPTNVGFAAGVPESAAGVPSASGTAGPMPTPGPQLGSSMGAGAAPPPGAGAPPMPGPGAAPPMAGGAPPPALIAALLAAHRGKRSGAKV